MRKLALLVSVVTVAFVAGTASSWAKNLYVDPEDGTDTSNTTCGQSLATPSTGPCATLNNALANAATNDSIFIEKGGSFGPIYLSSAISISGPADNSAVIAYSAGTAGCIGGSGCPAASYGVEIQAPNTDTIKLKNLIISNGGGSNGAVHIGNAFGVSFKGVAVRGGNGAIPQMVLANPTTTNSSGGPVQLYFANCDIAFSATGGGLLVQPTAPVSVLFQGGEVHNALFGVKFDSSSMSAGQNIAVGIDNTQFFSFQNSAVTARGPSGGNVHLLLARSSIVNTGSTAFNVNGANAVGILFEDAITGNAIGVGIGGGATVFGFGNSEIFGNGTQVSGGSIIEQPLQ
jgi:hypothetical protein